ncbi:hypothetical protein Tco_0901864, partial [Tanacetum coccineum]
IIAIISDTSLDNNSSDFASTSQISTSEEIVYSSLECKGPSKSLLKWYDYLSDEYKDNDRSNHLIFLDLILYFSVVIIVVVANLVISDMKMIEFHFLVPITNCVIGLANAKTWDAILSKTFGVKIPPTITCAKEKKGKRKIEEIIVLSSNNSDYSKGFPKEGPSVASVPEKEPSIQGLLDWYGYNTIEEYLSDIYFPSTDKDNTNKDGTYEDTIHESYFPMSKGKYVPVSQQNNPKVKSPIPITGCVLGLANITTWDEILKKIGVRKPQICADNAKGKRKVSYGS